MKYKLDPIVILEGVCKIGISFVFKHIQFSQHAPLETDFEVLDFYEA